jgi:hypothetical protein
MSLATTRRLTTSHSMTVLCKFPRGEKGSDTTLEHLDLLLQFRIHSILSQILCLLLDLAGLVAGHHGSHFR